MLNILVILFPHQLFENKYLDIIYEKDTKKHIIVWEHPYFFTEFLYHKMKLVLHRATMKKYFDELTIKKLYINHNDNYKKYITDFITNNNIHEIRFFNPIEKELIELINANKLLNTKIKCSIHNSPYFLGSNTTDDDTTTFLRHDAFYKNQRIKYNVMVSHHNNKIKPEGYKWSFDKENRLPFPKEQKDIKLSQNTSLEREKYIDSAIKYVSKYFNHHYGDCDKDDFIYPINHTESLKWLKHFIKYKLDNFGKYEDALSSTVQFGYHSLLSPLLNTGLITTYDILHYVSKYNNNIASKEGFIRQVIGWREYSYYIYKNFYDKLVISSIYNKNHKIICNKIWKGETQIPIIDDIIKKVNKYAYSHHIERLMCMGNFFLLVGISPQEIYKWFQTMYIDAYDVFMVSNVFGMLCYAKITDTNHMMTKPYLCSSNYLKKMSNYKSSNITINNNVYKWDMIIDALYYNHINNYVEIFSKNYSTAIAAKRWKTFTNTKKKEILELSKMYIKWLFTD